METDVSSSCPSDEDLSAFLNTKLDPAKAERIRVHILECPECKQWVGSIEYAKKYPGAKSRSGIPIIAWAAPAFFVLLLIVLAWLLPDADSDVPPDPGKRPSMALNTARLLPVRPVEPGRGYPAYRVGEMAWVEINFPGSRHYCLFYIDPSRKVEKIFPDLSNPDWPRNPIEIGGHSFILPWDQPGGGIPLKGGKGLAFFLVVGTEHEMGGEELRGLTAGLQAGIESGQGRSVQQTLNLAVKRPGWVAEVLGFEQE